MTETNQIGSKLALALSKAQGEMKAAKKDQDNPFFKSKYADLASVWEACREALSKNDLAVMQIPEVRDGVVGIRTKLVHSSGEFEEGFFPLAVSANAKAQEMGSAMKYLRRYALEAIVGVAAEDDDGNEAQKATTQKYQKAAPGTFSRKIPESKPEHNPEFVDRDGTVTTLADPSPESLVYATEERLQVLDDYIESQGVSKQTQRAWMDKAGVVVMADMPADKVESLITMLKEKSNA